MRIAIVTETFNPTGGGAERSVAQIASHLARRGHAVTLLAGYGASGKVGDRVQGEYEVIAMSDARLKSASQIRRFAVWAIDKIDGGDYDVSLSGTMAVPASVLQPRGGTVRETLDRNVAMRTSPVGRWFKQLQIALSPKQRALLALEQRTVSDTRVRRIVAVSEYVADQFRRHYHVDALKVTVLPNAAEAPQVDDAQRRQWRHELRDETSIATDAFVYLFAAYNPKLKGAESLLRAMRVVVDQRPDAMLIIVGGQSAWVRRRVESHGLTNHVRILGATERMAALYCAADVTVLPTHYDPASKVVIESLMLGTPAISTRYNGASDMITGSVDGPSGSGGGGARAGRVIDDPNDSEALAAAMLELTAPEELARCRAATAGLDTELSMARHVEALESILQAAALPG